MKVINKISDFFVNKKRNKNNDGGDLLKKAEVFLLLKVRVENLSEEDERYLELIRAPPD